MTPLVLALFAEGRTDERFLPILIQRTAERIIHERGRTMVDVLPPQVLRESRVGEASSLAQRILEAARRSAGYHALIVHADADHPTPERALEERFRPGCRLIQQALQAKEEVCQHVLAIVPVQATEAWMLADPEALRMVIGTDLPAEALGLAMRPAQVESEARPKQRLEEVGRTALAHRPRRRRRLDLGTLYEPLARLICLSRLAGVPAYRQFLHDLTQTLVALRLAE